MYSLNSKRIWVAGHRGMVGSAVVRALASEDCEVLLSDRKTVDLTRQADVEAFLSRERPHAVVMAAAKVGGILANDSFPADFIYQNLIMEANVVEASLRSGVEKLLFLGSSCIYPKHADQPIDEDALLTGPLEPTNEWYAIAKIAGIKLCQAYRKQHGADFISAMPTNLYGPGDNFDLSSSHVLPALMRKAYEAKVQGRSEIVVWGTGTPRREFLYSEDCADALVFLLKNYSDARHVNVGSGSDVTIAELARLVCDIVGFRGHIVFDETKPDGTPRKLMSNQKLRSMGWSPKNSLEAGIEKSFRWFIENVAQK